MREMKPNLTSWSRGVFALTVASLWPLASEAGGFREFLDSIDLNNYSMSLNLYMSESHYEGVDNFAIIYPVPNSFTHPTITDDVFFIRDGYLGLRKVTDSGWKYGGVGKVQTLGYGSSPNDIFSGMSRRDWSVQVGGMFGKRHGPVSIDLFATTDLLNKHGGQEYELKLSYAFASERFQFVPQLNLQYQSDDLVNYYYGVKNSEARPGRPAYLPGAATTPGLGVDFAWKFHPIWHLYVDVNVMPSLEQVDESH